MTCFVVGCAMETTQTQDTGEALTYSGSCSAPLVQGSSTLLWMDVKKPQLASGYLNFYFEGMKGTKHNNATVKLKHRDGSWAMFKTDDDIVDRTSTNATLHYMGTSFGGASHIVQYGDTMAVTGYFDEPLSIDPVCTVELKNLCGESNAVCTGSDQCCSGVCESNCPYPGCGHSCR